MAYKGMLAIVITIIIIVLGYRGGLSGAQDSKTGMQGGIAAEKVADMLHAVIQADRAFYTVHVVERLQEMGVVVAQQLAMHKDDDHLVSLLAELEELSDAEVEDRLTLAGAPGSVTVSVVAECPPPVARASVGDGVDVSTMRQGDRLWIKATWREEEP